MLIDFPRPLLSVLFAGSLVFFLLLTLCAGSDLSDRIASYRMEVRLDPVARTVSGQQVLTWHNRTGQPLEEFCFHLYLNAFRNNRSTFVREKGYQPPWDTPGVPDEYWGYVDVESIEIVPSGQSTRRVVGFSYVHPDDDNSEDRTVLSVRVDPAVPPAETVQFRIDFVSRLPRGTSRTGWVKDYFFVAQWFPKIGVFQNGSWNCHQYHLNTEYFADFGVYEVSLTVPSEFVVGATGKRLVRNDNGDGTTTYRYYQEDVHDFAWTASPRFLEKKRRFSSPGLPEVELTLLLMPEHEHLEARYFAAMEHALRHYGNWFGPYPYETLTVVDPAYGSDSSGMEYPTFVTGRAHFWSPPEVLSLEAVTVHEVGHQWWYAMVATNEFEESWLDEGLNSWSESRLLKYAYGSDHFMMRFLGGIPLVFRSVKIPLETVSLAGLRRSGELDVLVRPGWKYRGRESYQVNSYRKPEMILWTLERWLGEELMLSGMKSYFEQYQFKHPTTENFIQTINRVTGQDLNWFFEQTFYTSDLVDYAVASVKSIPLPSPQGFPDEEAGRNNESGSGGYLTEVIVERRQGARFPIEVLMVFDNGEKVREQWDGQYRWQRFSFLKEARLRYAVVDPERRLLLDIDPANNSRYAVESSDFSLATKKWASKWLFWLQNLLETFAFIG